MTQDQTAAALAYHFRLVVDNDEDLYHARLYLVGLARSSDPQHPASELRDLLAGWYDELVGLDERSALQREMLGTVRASIDWHQVAVDYLAEDES